VSKSILDNINIENVALTNNENENIKPDIDLSNLLKIEEFEGASYVENVISKSETVIELKKPTEVTINSDIKSDETKTIMGYDFKVRDTNPFNKQTNSLELNSPTVLDVAKQRVQQQMFETVEEIDNNCQVGDNIMPDIDLKHKTIGVLFDTYILVQFKDYIYLIDQHAGHERVLFDKYSAELQKAEVCTQPMLIPYILSVNNIEANYIDENLEVFKQLGFDIELFGNNKYRISEIPLALNNISVQAFFDDILSNISTKLTMSSKDYMRDYLAKTACKHAIKANDKLDNSQIEYLLELLMDTPVLLCPHGRPIVLKITEKEIEKWFKRIV
jgi:DNA mismatch repair protein MutL